MDLYMIGTIGWGILFCIGGFMYWSSKHKKFNDGE